jgi:hypothetical protein
MMPSYFFDLTTDMGLVRDPEGTELRNDAEAREYASSVVLELRKGRETETRAWHLDVYDVARRRCLELPFGGPDAMPVVEPGACGRDPDASEVQGKGARAERLSEMVSAGEV